MKNKINKIYPIFGYTYICLMWILSLSSFAIAFYNKSILFSIFGFIALIGGSLEFNYLKLRRIEELLQRT